MRRRLSIIPVFGVFLTGDCPRTHDAFQSSSDGDCGHTVPEEDAWGRRPLDLDGGGRPETQMPPEKHGTLAEGKVRW